MKPRLFDGEHLRGLRLHVLVVRAAMKPRLFDGEHAAAWRAASATAVCRNEAPPVRRGAHPSEEDPSGAVRAAMKPRLFDGEHPAAAAVTQQAHAVPQ